MYILFHIHFVETIHSSVSNDSSKDIELHTICCIFGWFM